MNALDSWLYGDETPRRRKIPKAVRDMVWMKYMKGKSEGKCYCCRIQTINFANFEVGHNKAVARGGKDNISNLRPICKTCNTSMGTKTIESFRAKHFAKPVKSTAESKTGRPAKKTVKASTASPPKKRRRRTNTEIPNIFDPRSW